MRDDLWTQPASPGVYTIGTRPDHDQHGADEHGAHRPARDRMGFEARADVPYTWHVAIADDLLTRGSTWLPDLGAEQHLVVDETVWNLYGQRISSVLDDAGVRFQVEVVAGAERAKTPDRAVALAHTFDAWGVRRSGPVVAIGGGSVLDLAGYTASIYRRGTRVVYVATTLLAMVDAAIGLKTGVNLGEAKNKLGTYYPAPTLIDLQFLESLSTHELRSGIAEIVKIATVRDEELFAALEQQGSSLLRSRFQGADVAGRRAAHRIVADAIRAMLGELQSNPIEVIKQRPADFGHAFGPAIELAGGIAHGFTVSIDMAAFAVVSWQRGHLTEADCHRFLRLLCDLRLPLTHPLVTDRLVRRALADAVRHRGGRQNLPLMTGIGTQPVFCDDIEPDEILEAVEYLTIAYSRSE